MRASRTYEIPRWYNQLHYVEVWIEKQALADTFSSFLRGRDVHIAVNKGYSSWTFLHDNCMRLKQIIDDTGKQIHILYFGDFDPSGDDMDRHLKNAFSQFNLEGKIDFRRIAVTREQIQEFNLPHKPQDEETVNKLKRDTRTKGFIEKHGGELYAVELDALLAIVPSELQNIIQRSVDQFFDRDIYEAALSLPEHQPDAIDGLVRKKLGKADILSG
jgi:hypothetical protein